MIHFNPACILTIAGTDPSGGAGIQADIKAISATGGYAASIITALVAQNTQGVYAIQDVPSEFVREQFRAVFSDLDVQAIKIGMLQDARMIEVIFSELMKINRKHVVFDPVMVAKGGAVLLDLNTIAYLKEKMTGVVSLITPNRFEAEHLLGTNIRTLEQMSSAAATLSAQLDSNVLIKGGHFKGEQSSDVLYSKDNHQHYWFHAERITTQNTHGTGCTLSSAIASYLGQGYTLYDAISSAKNYLTQAIQFAAHHKIGKGHGPVDHFYFLENRLFSN